MQVAKWGNSLAVRLPAAVVEALDLKEGDQIEIRVADSRRFEVARDRSVEKALERIPRICSTARSSRECRLRIRFSLRRCREYSKSQGRELRQPAIIVFLSLD